MIRAIAKMTAPLHRRVMLMVGRAVLELINDTLSVQGIQVSLSADEVRDNVERFQEYGLTSHPHPGAEGIVVCLGGSRDHAVVIACEDRRYRLTGLAQGEVALYDDLGQKVHLTRDGIVITTTRDNGVTINAPGVTINSPGKPVTVNASLLQVNCSIVATGDISDASGTKSMAGMRSAYNSHTHRDNSHGVNTNTPNQGM